MAPTPTLAPGLPTLTPQSAVPQSETAAPTNTPTPSNTPTATPEPVERFPLGQLFFYHENYEAAVPEYQLSLASGILDGLKTQEALLKLGQSFYHLGQYQAAAETFSELLAQISIDADQPNNFGQPGQGQPVDAYYWLAQAYQNLGDCPAAIGAYGTYLSFNPDMTAYVQPAIASCQLTLGDRTAAIEAYQTAATGQAPNLIRLNLHRQLADMYLEDKNYQAAIAEYQAILTFAVTDGTRGQTHYLIATTALAAGDDETANENFLIAVTEYPQVHESYLSLVDLLEAGFEVDQFQRGLIDYYAEVYDPAVAAFNAFIAANPVHREDVHLYLAWSYEGLGNTTAAIAELDAYIEASEPPPTSGEGDSSEAAADFPAVAAGILEKGKLQARANLYPEAIGTYQTYLERFLNGPEAPFAAWWLAALTEALDDIPTAITRYQEMAANYPDHQDADEALFHAGLLQRNQGNEAESIALWQETAETYPNQKYGGAALLWLLKTLPPEEAEPYRETAATLTGDNFYALRAVHQAQEIPPFSPAPSLDLEINPSEDQAVTETWLRDWLQLEPTVDVNALSPTLANDPRLIRGEKLWRLNLRELARSELEAVRQANDSDALLSYQMALFLRDLGLYRSSIAAAETVMRLASLNPLTAPTFLAQLAYPIYYADLITAEAQKYGYDPLLQFALIRQESLYESFAISSAVAQGLSQVIPDTGAYIATQLNWPNFENDDLYQPYVGIAFGGFYLDQQLDAFDRFVPAALSAYNAGPGNAARWYSQESNDIDRYHELVNFAETSLYIERIYIGHTIYRHLYQN
jgi:soluble lytic murein transglycosylase